MGRGHDGKGAGTSKNLVIPGAAQQRPGIYVLAAPFEQASYVIRAGWIPACAGMTNGARAPQKISSSRAQRSGDPGSTVWRKHPMPDGTSYVIRAG